MTFPKSECEKKLSDAGQAEEGMFSSLTVETLIYRVCCFNMFEVTTSSVRECCGIAKC